MGTVAGYFNQSENKYDIYFESDYYFKVLLSTNICKELNIAKEIMFEISCYAIGIIKDCTNHTCNNQVIMCHKQANIFKLIPENRNNDGKLLSIPTDRMEHKFEDEMYYFDSSNDMAYCTDCVESIEACCQGGWSMICNGVIFVQADNSFISCACPSPHNKKLCSAHWKYKCKKCNVSFCGQSCSNILQKEDLCRGRQCSTCKTYGCPKCIPMISWECCYQCNPPEYQGQIYKCQNNANCR